jgi:hypothetical protein
MESPFGGERGIQDKGVYDAISNASPTEKSEAGASHNFQQRAYIKLAMRNPFAAASVCLAGPNCALRNPERRHAAYCQ